MDMLGEIIVTTLIQLQNSPFWLQISTMNSEVRAWLVEWGEVGEGRVVAGVGGGWWKIINIYRKILRTATGAALVYNNSL